VFRTRTGCWIRIESAGLIERQWDIADPPSVTIRITGQWARCCETLTRSVRSFTGTYFRALLREEIRELLELLGRVRNPRRLPASAGTVLRPTTF